MHSSGEALPHKSHSGELHKFRSFMISTPKLWYSFVAGNACTATSMCMCKEAKLRQRALAEQKCGDLWHRAPGPEEAELLISSSSHQQLSHLAQKPTPPRISALVHLLPKSCAGQARTKLMR
jgi:hypothetical protein